jgi:hypothetical protein
MSTDWRSAAERLNNIASADRATRRRLCELSMAEARDDKISVKLEEGRTYGMRQQFYDNKLRRELARSLGRTDLVEDHW